jgi:hypothetical protein
MGLEFHLVLPLIFHERTQLRFSTYIKKRTSPSQARMKLMCLVYPIVLNGDKASVDTINLFLMELIFPRFGQELANKQ